MGLSSVIRWPVAVSGHDPCVGPPRLRLLCVGRDQSEASRPRHLLRLYVGELAAGPAAEALSRAVSRVGVVDTTEVFGGPQLGVVALVTSVLLDHLKCGGDVVAHPLVYQGDVLG